jgi:hypothetical protein
MKPWKTIASFAICTRMAIISCGVAEVKSCERHHFVIPRCGSFGVADTFQIPDGNGTVCEQPQLVWNDLSMNWSRFSSRKVSVLLAAIFWVTEKRALW